MSNRPHSTRGPDSVYPSRCKLRCLFGPRPISMYEPALSTQGRDPELQLPWSRSNQSVNSYKRLTSPVSNPSPSKLRNLKARLSGAEVYPRPPPDRIMTESCRENRPESRTHTPPRSSTVVLTPHRMSEAYIGGRLLSPSFLDLTPSPGYQPPEYDSPSDDNSPLEYASPFEYQSSSAYQSPFDYNSPSDYPSPFEYRSPSAYQSPPPALYASTSSHIKRTKRKPPPLILSDSFHATSCQSPTLDVPPDDANPAPLTPLTPFTPTSPRYRMPSEKEQFRRRLLKLQRTLGEQITPGLVVRPKLSPELTADPLPRAGTSLNPTSNYFPTKRSTLCAPTDQDLLDLDSRFSKDLPLLPTHMRKGSAPVPSSPSLHSPEHCLPEPVTLTPMTLTAFVGSVNAPRSITPTARSLEFVLNYDVQDSSSEDDEYECPRVFSFEDGSYPPSPLQSDYTCHSDDGDTVLVHMPYWTLDPSPSGNGTPDTPDTPGVRRKEPRHGWSGEWNQPHIQDVIEKLRSL